jgi:LmbE family N-acetylglucosaminyl deacetylase
LAFGAHPDDVEFGCGGIIAQESRAGRRVHLVVCSGGEAASHQGDRREEAERGAQALGASVSFVDLGGDAHVEATVANALRLAAVLREHRPATVLAPTPVENQHPDHARLGSLVRDAARLARFGGIGELTAPPHAIEQLFYYAVTPGAALAAMPVLVDVSAVVERWKLAMAAHASQVATRGYVELALAQARVRGLEAGVAYAMALYPNDPLVVDSLQQFTRSARRF